MYVLIYCQVISGHLGWVRSVAIDPSNEWFATGSGDRTIKVSVCIFISHFFLSLVQLWELSSGRLKLTLTGHISSVRGLAVSPRQPYLFSCGEDKQVKCWDLEQNKVKKHQILVIIVTIIIIRLLDIIMDILVECTVFQYIQPLM